MKTDPDNIKLIFGLKLKQARLTKTWSLAQLAKATGMSASYLNEIEKGKKYPKVEKVMQMSEALDVSYDNLINLKLERQLAPVGEILRTNILSELPLEMFGIDKGKLVEIIASAPMKVSAFIGTLMQMANHYDLTQESFYFAALRSYQELHGNYFPNLENEAVAFRKKLNIDSDAPFNSLVLGNLLEEQFGYEVGNHELSEYPELNNIRSVFIRDAKKILVNDQLADDQKAFLFAKEIGYQQLELTGDRALMTPWPRATSFDHVLNNSQASYFAGALLIPFKDLASRLEKFFALKTWNGKHLLKMMHDYRSSPEMLMVRLTNVIPKHFGLNGLFFLRFDYDAGSATVTQNKELFLSRNQGRKGIEMLNRTGADWVSTEVFPALIEHRANQKYSEPETFVHRFVSPSDKTAFIVFAMARITKRDKNASLCVMIGFEENATFKRKVSWAGDKKIASTVMKYDLNRLAKEEKFDRIKTAMLELMEKEKNAMNTDQLAS